MTWQPELASQTNLFQHYASPEAGGHDGRRCVFALRKEKIPGLLRLSAVPHGNELRLVCYPLYGPVEIILGDHIVGRHEEGRPGVLAGAMGSWLELRALYAADLEKAQIRVNRALAAFTINRVEHSDAR